MNYQELLKSDFTKDLVNEANKTGDYNDCSYVILYRTSDKKIIFAGDSAEKTWEYILENHKSDVTDVDVLIAPHHGRKTGRRRSCLYEQFRQKTPLPQGHSYQTQML